MRAARLDLTGYYKVGLGAGVSLDEAVAAFAADPGVERLERIGIHRLEGVSNDPYYRDSPNPSFDFDQCHPVLAKTLRDRLAKLRFGS